MGKIKMKNVLKHKRVIIFSLLAMGFIILIICIYALTYIDNKPVVFDNKDAKIISPEKIKLFDMEVTATGITYKNGESDGTIKYYAEITNLSENLNNVSVEFNLNTNWKNTLTKGSTYKFNSGNTLKTSVLSYPTSTASTSLKYKYPIRVLPFVKIKNPSIYAKVTYTRTASFIPDELKTETIYVVYNFSDYYDKTITVINN